MNEIFNFILNLMSALWSLIVSNWILSIGFIFLILGWIVTLFVGSRNE